MELSARVQPADRIALAAADVLTNRLLACSARRRSQWVLIEQGKRGVAIDSAVLNALYAQLEPVPVAFMIVTWHGSLFNGQTGDGWWGKNMISADHVQPLLFQRPDGSVYSNEVWGLAKLKLAEHAGVQTCMLVYNDKPLYDYFRRVTDDMVVGLTPGSLLGPDAPDFFFQLTRDRVTKVVD